MSQKVVNYAVNVALIVKAQNKEKDAFPLAGRCGSRIHPGLFTALNWF
jgi:hypothetical protein